MASTINISNGFVSTWELLDGSVAQADLTGDRRPGESDIEWEARLYYREIKSRPLDAVGVPVRVLRANSPTSSRFSRAWRLDRAGARITFDLAAMREVILSEVRRKRGELLDVSDREKNRLDDEGTNQQKQAYKDYRKALRDLPATVAAQLAGLNTPEALEAYQPVFPTAP